MKVRALIALLQQRPQDDDVIATKMLVDPDGGTDLHGLASVRVMAHFPLELGHTFEQAHAELSRRGTEMMDELPVVLLCLGPLPNRMASEILNRRMGLAVVKLNEKKTEG